MKRFIFIFISTLILSNITSFAKSNTNDNSNLKFNEYIFVSDGLIESAKTLSSDLQKLVNNDNLQFQTKKMLNFIKEQENLGLMGTLKHSIEEENIKTSDLIEKITLLTIENLKLESNDTNVEKYKAIISNIFLNLIVQNDCGWLVIDSNYSEFDPITTYIYNVLFTVEKNGIIFSLPLNFKITINGSTDDVLTISNDDKFDYKLEINGLKILKIK
jgi:toxin